MEEQEPRRREPGGETRHLTLGPPRCCYSRRRFDWEWQHPKDVKCQQDVFECIGCGKEESWDPLDPRGGCAACRAEGTVQPTNRAEGNAPFAKAKPLGLWTSKLHATPSAVCCHIPGGWEPGLGMKMGKKLHYLALLKTRVGAAKKAPEKLESVGRGKTHRGEFPNASTSLRGVSPL